MSDSAVVWEDSSAAAPAAGGDSSVHWEDQQHSAVAPTGPVGEQLANDSLIGSAGRVAGKVGSRIYENLKNLPASFDANPQTTAEKIGLGVGLPPPVTRAAAGVLHGVLGALDIPAAISDINASPNPAQHYQDAAAGAAGDLLTAAATQKAGEVGLDVAANPRAALSTAGKTVGGMVSDTPVLRKLAGVGKAYEAAKTAGAPAPKVLTNPAEIAEHTADILRNGPETAAEKYSAAKKAPGLKGSGYSEPAIEVKPEPGLMGNDAVPEKGTPVPEKGTPKAKASKPATTYDKITKESNDLRARQSQVGTEQGNQPLTPDEELTGPLAKTLEVIKKFREHANAIAKDETGSAGAPGTVDYQDRPITAELTKEVPARGFLNRIGADEASVERTDSQLGKDTHGTLKYQQEQYRNGTMKTPELHVDQNNNIIGADGRHRAIAAIREGGPNAKIKVRVVQHPFERTE